MINTTLNHKYKPEIKIFISKSSRPAAYGPILTGTSRFLIGKSHYLGFASLIKCPVPETIVGVDIF